MHPPAVNLTLVLKFGEEEERTGKGGEITPKTWKTVYSESGHCSILLSIVNTGW